MDIFIWVLACCVIYTFLTLVKEILEYILEDATKIHKDN